MSINPLLQNAVNSFAAVGGQANAAPNAGRTDASISSGSSPLGSWAPNDSWSPAEPEISAPVWTPVQTAPNSASAPFATAQFSNTADSAVSGTPGIEISGSAPSPIDPEPDFTGEAPVAGEPVYGADIGFSGDLSAPALPGDAAPIGPASVSIGADEWMLADGSSSEETSPREAASFANAYADMQAAFEFEMYEGMHEADLAEPTYSRDIPHQQLVPILGTMGDDNITVTQNANGSLLVMVNDEQTELPADMQGRPAIFAGEGNDTITVDKNVTVPLTILGGRGNDRITGGSGNDIIIANFGSNVINGGDGDDVIIAHGLDLPENAQGNTVRGGGGRDYIEGSGSKDILSGDEGNDTIYGLGGDDEIHGGAGNDYLDGGKGNDTLYGDAGDDNLIGGKGDDKLSGGEGYDLLIGASGNDVLDGGEGRDQIISTGSGDRITADANDLPVQLTASQEVPASFEARGIDIEMDRIESDLEMLASIDLGQELFSTIENTGHKVQIYRDIDGEGSKCANTDDAGRPGVGSDSWVNYNTTKASLEDGSPWEERAPVVSLFHELCHAFNAALGNLVDTFYRPDGSQAAGWEDGGIPGCEYQATGIANPKVTANPPRICENAIRKLLGHLYREQY